jgi:hypothetical protein
VVPKLYHSTNLFFGNPKSRKNTKFIQNLLNYIDTREVFRQIYKEYSEVTFSDIGNKSVLNNEDIVFRAIISSVSKERK